MGHNILGCAALAAWCTGPDAGENPWAMLAPGALSAPPGQPVLADATLVLQSLEHEDHGGDET